MPKEIEKHVILVIVIFILDGKFLLNLHFLEIGNILIYFFLVQKFKF
jgi:hypothetical protein